jgi:hypothetical protein
MEPNVTHYDNGPLPEHLAFAAYFTSNRQEWALPKAEALAYLDWCEGKALSVLGFEVWSPTTSGPTVVEFGVGNVEGIAATRDGIKQVADQDVNRWVFNIMVAEHGPTPTAG